jgi:hypothetical protein
MSYLSPHCCNTLPASCVATSDVCTSFLFTWEPCKARNGRICLSYCRCATGKTSTGRVYVDRNLTGDRISFTSVVGRVSHKLNLFQVDVHRCIASVTTEPSCAAGFSVELVPCRTRRQSAPLPGSSLSLRCTRQRGLGRDA